MTSHHRVTHVLLGLIAVLLGILVLRPNGGPTRVLAEDQADEFEVYIEPGTYPLRAPDGSALQQGKVVVDLTNGNVWGFPTIGREPYPRGVQPEPPVSKPIYLGKFDFAEMRKRP